MKDEWLWLLKKYTEEGARTKFEDVCESLYKKKYPSENVKGVRVVVGDGGIDVFIGNLGAEAIRIVQCKFFINGIGESQKDQIRKSFKTVIESPHFTCRRWILCLPIKLSIDEHKWWTGWKNRQEKKYGKGFIELEDGADLIDDLKEFNLYDEVFQMDLKNTISEIHSKVTVMDLNLSKLYRSNPTLPEKRNYLFNDNLIDRTVSSFLNEDNTTGTLSEVLSNGTRGKGKRIALLSTAGYGKSTELQQLAASNCNEDSCYYPILFYLRDYNGQTIYSWLSEAVGSEWVNIEKSTLLIVFDGLDEIMESHFQHFINAINDFITQHESVNVVISSRFNFIAPDEHSQIRSFDFYFLNKLSEVEIDGFLNKKLSSKKDDFLKEIDRVGFSDYLENPFYLSKLLYIQNQIGIDAKSNFPTSRGELLKEILFERLSKDGIRFRDNEIADVLFPIAKKLAFCMSMMGLTTISDNNVKSIVKSKREREDFNKFCAINKQIKGQVAWWTFEHRNIQEYLTAEVLSKLSLEKIIEIVAIDNNRTKLSPRLLNTVSFLFEIIDPKAALFEELLNWLIENEPEFILRFERERLSRDKRHYIFKKIWHLYKHTKKMTLRISGHIKLEQLADFIEIDASLVDFLLEEVSGYLDTGLAYDALDLIGRMHKPYVVQQKVKTILIPFLRDNKYSDFIHGEIIATFIDLKFLSKEDFENVLTNLNDKEGFESRQACIRFLVRTSYYNEYADFILSTIPIYDKGQAHTSYGGIDSLLCQLICRFDTEDSILKVLKFLIANPKRIRFHYKLGFQFELSDFKKILKNASIVGGNNHQIISTVYKLLHKVKYVWTKKDWMEPFVTFFAQVSSTGKVFKTLYKWDREARLSSYFLDNSSCDFLLEEFLSNKISDTELNNYLGWSRIYSPDQVLYFETIINNLGGQVKIEDYLKDYAILQQHIAIKNTKILLSGKEELFSEIRKMYTLIGKDKIANTDLYTADLEWYSSSLAYKAINKKLLRRSEAISSEDLCAEYADEEWEWFRIFSIKALLSNEEQKAPIDEKIMLFIKDWCTEKVKTVNFKYTYQDSKDRRVSVKQKQSVIISLIDLIDLELEDNLWLKLLEADASGYFDTTANLSEKILKGVKCREQLIDAILNNIREGMLSKYVQLNHFKLCGELKIIEILPDLYTAITEDKRFDGIDKRELTKTYVRLGGEFTDFVGFLRIPNDKKSLEVQVSWEWYLLMELKSTNPDRVKELLCESFSSAKTSFDLKKLCAVELILMGNIEALQFWCDCLLEERESFIGDGYEKLSSGIKTMPSSEVISLLLDVLTRVYDEEIYLELKWPDSIEDKIYTWLDALSENNEVLFDIISNKLLEIVAIFSCNTDLSYAIRYRYERFCQFFYSRKKRECTLSEAVNLFQEVNSI
ncbi:NACHT domain-containing protein [Sphingobacterium sp. SYP-B4668]|uniref:NACHT domain-containing protein n=1 Tax=Sphingobacterium sp. SYP-B4668 TaxID=2996035 RepID=UPI0022DE833B|nr:hypothetical protein [Sphingobacterium sp. SYP-B4668]